MATLSTAQRKDQIMSVIRVSSGNFLEMYDFFVFGYYAAAIGRAFFPSGSEFAQLMLAFMTFGAGFLMRPLGAHFSRRLYRPPRPPRRPDADAGLDGARHAFDRGHARLRHHRRVRRR